MMLSNGTEEGGVFLDEPLEFVEHNEKGTGVRCLRCRPYLSPSSLFSGVTMSYWWTPARKGTISGDGGRVQVVVPIFHRTVKFGLSELVFESFGNKEYFGFGVWVC